jgi:lipopolysaccharide transport system ATP-binding protein
MEKDIAIQVKNVSKNFKIPHEKISTLRGAFVSAFRQKTYEQFKALDDVSFEVKKGEFFGIIGRNGSGKSTLLKILANIYTAELGTVEINGRISPFLELGIGFNPELSGRDNIYLNATVLGLTEKQINQKFDDIVAFSELGRFIDQKVKNYSSGMQVRLAFSVAIHANREILLMDEVLAVGDTNFQSKCMEEFNKYKDLGKTVVLVTHDIATVQRYCDRAMLLRAGKVEMIGDPEAVGNKYIYQNMSDEEKRIFDEEQRRRRKAEKETAKVNQGKFEPPASEISNNPKEGKIAKITKVQFLGETGKTKNIFKTGDNLTVRVYFQNQSKARILNFGLAIYDNDSRYIFGTNTQLDKINLPKIIKNGYFEVSYSRIPLKQNSYYVKVGIWGDNLTKLIDFLDKSKYFRVVQEDKYEGMVNLEHRWL